MAAGKRWTRDELLVALNIYHKLTFGQLDGRQPVIISVAKRMNRTPGSLAMKLTNLASLDPVLKLRGIKGLKGSSVLDRKVWSEFHENSGELVPESELALRQLYEVEVTGMVEVIPGLGIRVARERKTFETETTGMVKIRLGQDYFRDAVLNNFGGQCGVTGLPIRELLVASHIVPWAIEPSQRLNVRNGISLSRLHDGAFDRGLITFDDSYRLVLSPRLQEFLDAQSVSEAFGNYSREMLRLPDEAVHPDLLLLARHRKEIFQAA